MMFVSQGVSARYLSGNLAVTGIWSGSRNLRWVRTFTPRRGRLHHGIYAGARKVDHYSGLAHGLRRGPVAEVPFAHFACGRRVWVRSKLPGRRLVGTSQTNAACNTPPDRGCADSFALAVSEPRVAMSYAGFVQADSICRAVCSTASDPMCTAALSARTE
jgi:hypothetical protein